MYKLKNKIVVIDSLIKIYIEYKNEDDYYQKEYMFKMILDIEKCGDVLYVKNKQEIENKIKLKLNINSLFLQNKFIGTYKNKSMRFIAFSSKKILRNHKIDYLLN